jgi:hypothetical protein
MATRLTSVVIDSADPPALARWWAAALGWEIGAVLADETEVRPPAGEPGLILSICLVDDQKVVQNRIHLDLSSATAAGQDELVRRLLAAGAVEADVGQGKDVPWVVLRDPEGNEFCVLEPRPEYAATGSVAAVVVAALDPVGLARFWAEAAGMRLSADPETGVAGLVRPDGTGPWLEFVPTTQAHTVKNRVHLDIAPYRDDDQTTEVSRLIDRGARPAEVGQSKAPPEEITWVVLADPEGNEFCVLSSRA